MCEEDGAAGLFREQKLSAQSRTICPAKEQEMWEAPESGVTRGAALSAIWGAPAPLTRRSSQQHKTTQTTWAQRRVEPEMKTGDKGKRMLQLNITMCEERVVRSRSGRGHEVKRSRHTLQYYSTAVNCVSCLGKSSPAVTIKISSTSLKCDTSESDNTSPTPCSYL